jgi:hypothetical protein
MTASRITRTGIALAALLLAGLVADARAQAMDPDAERARQIVLRIRRSMREIDKLLLQGGQEAQLDPKLTQVVDDLEKLLEETESKSQGVVQNLDELIQMSKYQQSKQGGGG